MTRGTKVCPHCKGPLVRKGKTGPFPKYCSTNCRARAWETENREYVKAQAAARHRASYQPVSHDHVCTVCGTSFTSRFRTAKYCSRKCAYRAQTQVQRDSGWLDTYLQTPKSKEQRRRSFVEWKEKYPERAKESRRRSDAKRGRVTRRFAILDRDGWVCQLCGKPILWDADVNDPLSAHVDHITPRALGGSHDPSNLQAAHRLCNMQKGTRLHV